MFGSKVEVMVSFTYDELLIFFWVNLFHWKITFGSLKLNTNLIQLRFEMSEIWQFEVDTTILCLKLCSIFTVCLLNQNYSKANNFEKFLKNSTSLQICMTLLLFIAFIAFEFWWYLFYLFIDNSLFGVAILVIIIVFVQHISNC